MFYIHELGVLIVYWMVQLAVPRRLLMGLFGIFAGKGCVLFAPIENSFISFFGRL
ncbi:hypothetical protein ADIS_0759 [Lunatimonas lonarensis]|uniref:Uncharacterized protein n=1 Tax=Lunatimonas lonarensis TaxID=1232681 RepID=R7ZXR7_9BACT|nr:hypothetical protein ADIS_0759 [Lunatimonas lonarensis]